MDYKVAGYTILETMIFLVVSAALFVSAMSLVNGRQGRTEFSTGVREFESLLQDISNDISDGYFTNSATGGHLICQNVTASDLYLGLSVDDNQGANAGCIVIGKAIQFGPQGQSQDKFRLITLFGRQFIDASPNQGDVQNINNTRGSGVYPAAPGTKAGYTDTPDTSELMSIKGGVTVECVLYNNYSNQDFNPTTPVTYSQPCSNATIAGKMIQTDGLAFMTTFHGSSLSNDTQTGSTHINIVVFKRGAGGPIIGRNPLIYVNELMSYKTDANASASHSCDPSNVNSNTCFNPSGGVFMCLQSNGSSQHALINIGGNVSNNASKTGIQNGSC